MIAGRLRARYAAERPSTHLVVTVLSVLRLLDAAFVITVAIRLCARHGCPTAQPAAADAHANCGNYPSRHRGIVFVAVACGALVG